MNRYPEPLAGPRVPQPQHEVGTPNTDEQSRIFDRYTQVSRIEEVTLTVDQATRLGAAR